MSKAQTGWAEVDSKSNAIATATKALTANKQHIIYAVDASFSATAVALLQIKDGSTVVWEGYVYDSREVTFPGGLSITKNTACSAVLAAGGGGITGKVTLHGRSS